MNRRRRHRSTQHRFAPYRRFRPQIMVLGMLGILAGGVMLFAGTEVHGPALTTSTAAIGRDEQQDAAKLYDGLIESATKMEIAVMVGTSNLAFTIDEKTTVTLNGKSVEPTELKTGDEARLSAAQTHTGILYASRVVATRKGLPL